MYKVWNVTEKEKGKHIIPIWDGDTYSYTVCETDEEYEEEKERIKKIDEEAERKHQEYLDYLKREEQKI